LVELDAEDSLVHLEAADAGTLGRVLIEKGKTIVLGTELAQFTTGATKQAETPAQAPAPQKAPMSTPTSAGGKVTPILMPQAGNTMEEGKILSWKVKVGDRVTVGQVICEIETDKAS